jgi:putative nucleotidyltransferase with HDIG domain
MVQEQQGIFMPDLQTTFNNRCLLAKNLPTLPVVLEEATRAADDPKTTLPQLADIIGRDQVLSGKVLKMVNSPTYGFPGRIASIQNALALLGLNVMKSLIISTAIFENLPAGMTELWRHSVGCSMACSELGRVLQSGNVDELFVAGLLHDIGKVITAVQLPEAREEITRLVLEEDLFYREAEMRVLGLDHSRIGAWLAEQWNLPANLRSAMNYHHRPLGDKNFTTVSCVAHVGDFLARLLEFGSGGDENVPILNPHAVKQLDLNQRKICRLVDTLGEKFEHGEVICF